MASRPKWYKCMRPEGLISKLDTEIGMTRYFLTKEEAQEAVGLLRDLEKKFAGKGFGTLEDCISWLANDIVEALEP